MNISDLAGHDQQLIADLARRLAPRLDQIADRCARILAPAGVDGADREADRASAAAVRGLVTGFLGELANGQFERALGHCLDLLEPRFRGALAGAQALPGGLRSLLSSYANLRGVLREEIVLAMAGDPAAADAARQSFSHLAAVVEEAVILLYVRLSDEEAERRRRELVAARDEALEVSRLKSAFVAAMAHEIRTPLNVILGYTDLLSERLAELHDEPAQQYAAPISRSGRRLLDTVGAILDLSRIEAGAYPLAPRILPLAAIVDRQVQDLRVLAQQKGLELDYRNDATDAMVTFDEQCLSNTIINLVQNAIKFTPHGTVSIAIARAASGHIKLAVGDSGVGIDPAYLPHLFEPFSRGAQLANQRFEGAGLGLALVKRYVELNGARIEVASVRNKGTVFTVVMPPAPAAAFG